jgi:hypothetical protein
MSGEFTSSSWECARTRRTAVCVRWLSSLTLSLCASLLDPGAAPAAAIDKDGWTPIRFEGGQILLPVTLNGIEGEAVIDSGSEINGIDAIFVREHENELNFGRTISVQGVYATEQQRLVNGATVGMFGIDLPASGLVPTNLAPSLLLRGWISPTLRTSKCARRRGRSCRW